MKSRLASRLGITLVVLFALPISAVRALPIRASTAFSNLYEGDVYPVPGFTAMGSGFVSGPSSDGNILTLRNDATHTGWIQANSWSPDASVGYSLEFRVKIDTDAASLAKGAIAFELRDVHGWDVIGIGSSFVKRYVGDKTLSTSDNTDDYHTFRVVRVPVVDTWRVWRDGVELFLPGPAPLNGSIATGGDPFYFASGSTDWGGPTVHIDYVRFDLSGAFEPVPIPEPSSFLIMALGLTGVAGRRRRHF